MHFLRGIYIGTNNTFFELNLFLFNGTIFVFIIFYFKYRLGFQIIGNKFLFIKNYLL